jgi:hypothetical protein
MSMSRKNYETIAAILAGDFATGTAAQRITVRNVTLSMADAFQRDNAGFSRERFYIAVGLSPEGFLPASVLADYTAERKRRSA